MDPNFWTGVDTGLKLTESHRFVLNELMQHIEDIEQRIAHFDQHLLAESENERNWLVLLQTLPGVDLIGAPCCW